MQTAKTHLAEKAEIMVAAEQLKYITTHWEAHESCLITSIWQYYEPASIVMEQALIRSCGSTKTTDCGMCMVVSTV